MFKRFTFLLAFLLFFSSLSFHASAAEQQERWRGDGGQIVQQAAVKYSAAVGTAVQKQKAQPAKRYNARTVKELHAVIAAQLDVRSTNFSVVYSGKLSTAMKDMEQGINRYIYNNDYFRGVVSKWEYSQKGNVLGFKFVYLTTPSQEAVIQQKVKEVVRKIITPSMTDVQKVKAVNDYIVLNSEYSFDTKTTPHAVFAILNEGKGVCQAYALLAYRLLKEAKMDVRYVTGFAGEDHAWNLVKVDGAWFHLDTTWNDPVFDSNDGDMRDFVSYQYFLVSDKKIAKDHRADQESDYPKAASERFAALHAVEEPAEADGVLYFSNPDDNYRLYAVNYNQPVPRAVKISNTVAESIVYANGWLYFSNYSDSGYLYKMKTNGSNKTLLAPREVTSVKRKGNEVIAYDGKTAVYKENIAVK